MQVVHTLIAGLLDWKAGRCGSEFVWIPSNQIEQRSSRIRSPGRILAKPTSSAKAIDAHAYGVFVTSLYAGSRGTSC